MNRETILQIVSSIVTLSGVVVLLNSSDMGYNSIHDFWQNKMGGSGDPSTYDTILNGFMSSYRLLGGVLLGVGLNTLLHSLLSKTKR